jgi:SulP family sulfate permease
MPDSESGGPSTSPFLPQFFSTLKEGYGWGLLRTDALAGIMVGIVALPLAIAFAIASGVTPTAGLVTAVVAGLILSCFGGSRVQIGGPTSAFVVLLYTIVQKHGTDGLMVATLMAGLILVAMGLLRMGGLVKFIPYPLSVGFTTGVAVLIATTQIPDVLGLELASKDSHFLARLGACLEARHTFNPWAVGVAAGTIAIALIWTRLVPRLSGSLVAIVTATVATSLFEFPVETIGTRFGAVSAGFPTPHLPRLSIELIIAMSSPALAIAFLASLETLLSATVADGMTGRRHRSDMELVALGAANIVSPLFGGIPAVGAVARTATNVRSGGKTPVAGIVHALVLLVILLVAGKWAALIPMSALGGILLLVAWNMSEMQTFKTLLRAPKGDVLVLLTAFLLTVFVDLTVAIEVGFGLAAALFMKRMAEVSEVRWISHELNQRAEAAGTTDRKVPPGVEVFSIQGSFFFGAADKFRTALEGHRRMPKTLILEMHDVLSLDATGLKAIEELSKGCRKRGGRLMLTGVHAQPMAALVHSGWLDRIGEDNVFDDLDDALTACAPATP